MCSDVAAAPTGSDVGCVSGVVVVGDPGMRGFFLEMVREIVARTDPARRVWTATGSPAHVAAADLVIDLTGDPVETAALAQQCGGAQTPLLVVAADEPALWVLPFLSGGCWNCVTTSRSQLAPSVDPQPTAWEVLPWAAAVGAGLLQKQRGEFADSYVLHESWCDSGVLRPQWDAQPVWRHPGCGQHLGEPASYEQLALLS